MQEIFHCSIVFFGNSAPRNINFRHDLHDANEKSNYAKHDDCCCCCGGNRVWIRCKGSDSPLAKVIEDFAYKPVSQILTITNKAIVT